MQSHQRNLRAFIIGIGFADEGRVVEKLIECLAAIAGIHGCIYQFL